MEELPTQTGSGGRQCDSEFCQFLAALNFTPGSNAADILGQALNRRFPHELAFCELPIGQVKTIAARKDCRSCRFASAIIQSRSDAEMTPDTICFASFPKAHFHFNLGYHRANGRTRYIMSKFGEQIKFLDSDTVSCYEAGKLVDPDGVDYPRITSWLALCEKLHEVCPQTTKAHRENLLPSLRVVDVKEMRLTDIPWGLRYIALSYVWGGASPPRLLKADLEFWKTGGSIQRRWDKFPKSIRDSMEVVRKLGLRYFWFDSLCLLQDDSDELRKSINNMDMIYERAYVTIVAANSTSANGGLPGVTEPRLPNQTIQYIKPGLSVVNIAPLDAHLKTSAWATRGWTLQEQHLSRRTLNFVNGQVYFRCRQRIWAEDTCRDMAPKSSSSIEWGNNYIALAREGMDEMEYFLQPYDFLIIALEEFQRRNLTMENDALNAMAGFLQRVSEAAKTEMVEGFPVKLLPTLLIFRNRVENTQYSRDVHRRTDFPSWSWAGWHAPSFWEHWKEIDITEGEQEVVEWLERGNWIVWSVLKVGSVSKVIHNPATIRQEFAADIAADSTTLDNMSAPINPTCSEHGSHAITSARPFSHYTASSRQPATEMSVPSNIPYSLLVFQTLSVQLKLGSTFSDLYCRFALFDNAGSACGEVIPDFMPDISTSEKNDGLETLRVDAEATSPTMPIQEFIVLSERHHKPNMNVSAPGDDEYNDEFANLVERDTYWIMMVEYVVDKGVYERRGIGHVLKTAVEGSFVPGPSWKEIVLA